MNLVGCGGGALAPFAMAMSRNRSAMLSASRFARSRSSAEESSCGGEGFQRVVGGAEAAAAVLPKRHGVDQRPPPPLCCNKNSCKGRLLRSSSSCRSTPAQKRNSLSRKLNSRTTKSGVNRGTATDKIVTWLVSARRCMEKRRDNGRSSAAFLLAPEKAENDPVTATRMAWL